MFLNKTMMSLGAGLIIINGFCALAQAEGNIHLGNLEINPLISIEETYDDNIFLESDNQNEDWITTTKIGADLMMPLAPAREEDFMLKAKYDVDILSFLNESEQNRLDHTLITAIDLDFANDFSLKVKDRLVKTGVPPNSELTALEERLSNSAKVALGYKREMIGFDLGYENKRDDYNNFNELDRYEHIVSLTAYYQLFPKTSVFTEFNFGSIEYDVNTTNSNSGYNQGCLGLKGELASKLTGIAKVGYKSSDYDQAAKDDFAGITTYLNLIYELQERNTLNIYAERGVEESSYSTNSYYAMNKIGLKFTHELNEKWVLLADGKYGLNKYPDQTTEGSQSAKREDRIYNVSIGLRFNMNERTNISGAYEYKQRDSEFSQFGYEDNKISAKVSFTL
ncbi:MAG: outer membrane beta-barrel protein [Candidatus Omnitrophota bacterium]